METQELSVKEKFKKLGTCSQLYFNLLNREFDNLHDIAVSLSILGLVAHEQGHHLAAQRQFYQSWLIFRKTGWESGESCLS